MADVRKTVWSMILVFLIQNSVARAQAVSKAPKEAMASSELDSSALRDNDLPVEYKKFSHTIFVESFRGGSYEKAGISRYYFRVSIFATQVNKTEDASSKKIGCIPSYRPNSQVWWESE